MPFTAADHNALHAKIGLGLPTNLVDGQSGHIAAHELIDSATDLGLPLDITSGDAGHAAATELLRTWLADATPGPRGAVGPRAINQPGGYTVLSPGATTWAATINAGSAGDHFWLPAGTYTLGTETTLVLKSNMIIAGELGAVIDGQNTKINMCFASGGTGTGVEIHNLLIKNFTAAAPAGGRGAIWWNSSGQTGWNVHHNELTANTSAIRHGSSSSVHHNYSHHNVQYGFESYRSEGTIVEDNESSNDNTTDVSNADQGATKWTCCLNTKVRHNWIHDSQPWGTGNPTGRGAGSAIWFDHVNNVDGYQGHGCIAEWNLVEDCHQSGMEYEVGPDGMIIRYNTVQRCDGYHIFISTSPLVEVYENTIHPTLTTTGARAMMLQEDLNRTEGSSLHDNNVHHNHMDISSPVAGAPMVGLFMPAPTDYPTWDDAAKNNRYENNVYKVASLTGSYWFHLGSLRTFSYWQTTAGRDLGGSQSL